MEPDPLELETRRRLYHHIVRHPGQYLRELQRAVGMAMGALEYHLEALVSAGLVTVLQEANKRFFPAVMDAHDKRILAFLRQAMPRRALLVVLEHGPATKGRLLGGLAVAPSTLNYHLRRLVEGGLLTEARAGREVVYEAADPASLQRLLVAYQSSFFDRIVDKFLEGMDAMR